MSTALASKTRAESNPRKVSKMMGVRHVSVLLAAIVASTLATAQAQVSGDCGGGKNGKRPSNNCAVNRPYSSYGDETYWDNCANPYYCYYNSAPKYGSTGPYGFSGWNPCSNVVGAYSQGQCRVCVGSFGSWGSCSSTQCGVYGTRTRKYTQTTTRSGRGAVECPYSHNHASSRSRVIRGTVLLRRRLRHLRLRLDPTCTCTRRERRSRTTATSTAAPRRRGIRWENSASSPGARERCARNGSW